MRLDEVLFLVFDFFNKNFVMPPAMIF